MALLDLDLANCVYRSWRCLCVSIIRWLEVGGWDIIDIKLKLFPSWSVPCSLHCCWRLSLLKRYYLLYKSLQHVACDILVANGTEDIKFKTTVSWLCCYDCYHDSLFTEQNGRFFVKFSHLISQIDAVLCKFRVLRRISGPKRVKETRGGDNYKMRSVIACAVQVLLGW
jgi:hypothetical protein